MLGVLYEANVLCNVTGERMNGIVQRGTESLHTVQPLFAVIEKRMQTAIRFFNIHQYDSALSILEEIENRTQNITVRKQLEDLKTVSRAYSAWDRFDHEKALEYLKKLKGDQFNDNKQFLGKLHRADEELITQYYIADL